MKNGAAVGVLFAIGVGVNLVFGRRGFLPLDQSIIFDGGWRLVSGQVPFADFSAPSAFVPSAMQVPFFKALGVSWFAYCLHASVVNGVFAAAAYGLLRVAGSTTIEALLFGSLTAFFFYPPTGTPFMDQHSFFFMMLMFLAAAAGAVAIGRREILLWSAVPLLFTLGFLSGQIPVSFGALAVAALVAWQPSRAPRRIAALTVGTLAVALLILVVRFVWPFDLAAALRATVVAPLEVAGDRTARSGIVGPVRMIAATVWRLPFWANLWSLDAALIAAIPLAFVHRSEERWLIRTWAFLACLFGTAGFLGYTRTLLVTGLGLAMLLVALVAVAVRLAMPRRLAAAAFAILALLAIRDTVVFVRVVDSARLPHVAFDAAEAARAEGKLPAGLEFMRWSRGPSSYEPEEMSALVDFLRNADGAFLLIGDSSILYGLSGKPSVSPVLWFDPGLTIPRLKSPQFAEFENDVIARMRRTGVRRIVLERPITWTLLSLSDFPRLAAWTRSGACGERRFGAARVLELCPELRE